MSWTFGTNEHLNEADIAFKTMILKKTKDEHPTEKEMQEHSSEYSAWVKELSSRMFSDLSENSQVIQSEHGDREEGFRQAQRNRWFETFRLLRMAAEVGVDGGNMICAGIRANPEITGTAKFRAVNSLYARSIRTFVEIIYLLEGGMADAAFARWRTLHELATTALFLQQEGDEISHRYFASRACQDFKRAKTIRQQPAMIGLEPISDELFNSLKEKADAVKSRVGSQIEPVWGWASPVIGNSKVNFPSVERHVNLQHWRPYAEWANQEVHAGYVPPESSPSLQSNPVKTAIVAQSHFGVGSTALFASKAMSNAMTALALIEPTLDRLALVNVMSTIANRLERENKKRA